MKMLSHGDSPLCMVGTQNKCTQRGFKTLPSDALSAVGTNKLNFTLKLIATSTIMSAMDELHERMQQAKIIVGFPGIGKSTLAQKAAAGKYTSWNVKQIFDEPNYAKGNEKAFLDGLLELAKQPETVLLLPAHRFVSYIHTQMVSDTYTL